MLQACVMYTRMYVCTCMHIDIINVVQSCVIMHVHIPCAIFDAVKGAKSQAFDALEEDLN